MLLLLLACAIESRPDPPVESGVTNDTAPVDADGDGSPSDVDCDDEDPSRHPGAVELCDGIDQDCVWAGPNGEEDMDGDGVRACDGDCDDRDPDIHRGAAQGCDTVDADCDGEVPDDADGDGALACEDCDDLDGGTLPGAFEVCDGVDDDCDGEVDEACVTCDVSVPGDAATVQEGIDLAEAGVVVCVGPGTWTEKIDFGGVDLTLVGLGGAGSTVLDGGGCCEDYGAVVRFASGESAAATLRGFTITNGVSHDHGGGILVSGASPTLEHLVVTGNYAWDWADLGGGGGIYVEDGAPTLRDLRIEGNFGEWNWENEVHGLGGGLFLDRADAVVENVVVRENWAGTGAGIFLRDSDAVFVNVLILDNWAQGAGGGGVFLSSGAPSFANVAIVDNSSAPYWYSADGGGLYDAGSTATFTNVVFHRNSASRSGDDVYARETGPTFRFSDVGEVVGDVVLEGCLSVGPVFYDATWHLDPASPLVDAGDPAILDPDGSTSDIGAFGGPGASSWDLDGDGFPAWWQPGGWDAAYGTDCDDEEATVYPGAGC